MNIDVSILPTVHYEITETEIGDFEQEYLGQIVHPYLIQKDINRDIALLCFLDKKDEKIISFVIAKLRKDNIWVIQNKNSWVDTE